MPGQRELIILLQSSPIDLVKVKAKLAKLQMSELLLLCRETPELAEKLTDDQLEEDWRQFLTRFQVRPNTPDFRLEPQPPLRNSQLVLGITFFFLSHKDPISLSHALRYQSFHGFYVTINNFCKELLDSSLHENDFLTKQQCLYHFLQEAEKGLAQHEGPGVLLLATAYYMMAIAAKNQQQLSIAEVSLYKALTFAYCAKKLSASDISYHNAYLGQGLAISNPFQLKSFDEIIKGLNDQAEELLPIAKRQAAIDEGSEFARKIKRSNRLTKDRPEKLSHFFRTQASAAATTQPLPTPSKK